MALHRMLTAMVGPEINWAAGDVVELDDASARRFVDAGIAEPYGTGKPVAITVQEPDAPKRGKGRGRKVTTAVEADDVTTATED